MAGKSGSGELSGAVLRPKGVIQRKDGNALVLDAEAYNMTGEQIVEGLEQTTGLKVELIEKPRNAGRSFAVGNWNACTWVPGQESSGEAVWKKRKPVKPELN